MSKDTHELALSWRFIFSSLRRAGPRTYAEIRADLEAVLKRAGGKRMSRDQIRKMIEEDQIKRYGRKLTPSEVQAEIRKRLDRS